MDYLKEGEHFGEKKQQLVVKDVILSKANASPTDHIPWHYHKHAYFLYNINGYLNEVTKKGTLELQPNTLLYHHSQEPHYNKDIQKEFDFLHVELPSAWFLKYDLSPSLIEGDLLLKDPSLQTLFHKIHVESQLADQATNLAIDGLLLQTFGQITRLQAQDLDIHKPLWVNKLIELVNEERWEVLSLNYLATELQLHPVYLSRKFPVYFKMSFGEYVREQKLKKAIDLLLYHPISQAEVAYQCGFSDESHFIRIFKLKYGVTPAVFKNQHRG
ncbi:MULTISPECIES: helix-turn-helix domain-containing protein [Myroides]|uniref:helix-turn-helix domain-containing protein n=1 Tax=Myroides TaxID=76831 RepID=UPI0008F489E7|nr:MULTISPECIES: helix-turn-helix domain-containing protein [Myroides]APA93332.1 AraC family transcriptional regulator [Myroides sp. ZB35]MDX4975147.1 helix-turn-helix transcriptional regulator [Myroides odoratimimus]